MRHLTIALITAGSLLMTVSASALTAKQIVEKEVIVQMPDGTESVTREAAEMVVPGERIVYTLNYTNDEAQPASDLVLTMPVPSLVRYMDGSATEVGARVVYSADGGKSFADRPSVQIADIDGTFRRASSGEITHIRWTVPGPVAAGENGSLSFKGVLK
jgi:uncharacterized repeat protein (TIGR01451 family)